MKIDIYFNGALCESRFIPGQFYEEKDAMTEKMFHFTGRRIDRMIEKPWIIVPSDQNPDDPKEYRKDEAAYAGAQQRWKDISNALMTEADKNRRNDKGERPVIGEYLESLARLSMPKEVGDMQKAGGTKFGILDTVITWGKGRPEGGYIYETTPIRNEEFTAPILEQDMDLTPVQIVPKTTGSPSTAPKSKEDVSGKFFNAGLDAFTHLHPSLTPTRTTTPDVITDSSTSPQKKRPYANLQPEEPRKRYPGHDRVPLPKGPTLEEQFNPITAATDFDQNTGRSPFPMNNARTPASHSKGNSKKGGLQGWEYLAE